MSSVMQDLIKAAEAFDAKLTQDLAKANPTEKAWLTALHTFPQFKELQMQDMCLFHERLVLHLSYLVKCPGFSALDPKTLSDCFWALSASSGDWVKPGMSSAHYRSNLAGARVAPLIKLSQIINPPEKDDLFKLASTSSAGIGLLDNILSFGDAATKAIILGGIACRNHVTLFQKVQNTINDPEITKAALKYLEEVPATSKTELGKRMIKKFMPEVDASWAEYASDSFTPSAADSLAALHRLFKVHESNGLEITDPVQRAMGGLLNKVLKEKPKGSQILLADAVYTNQNQLYTTLLDTGMSPNFSIPTPSGAPMTFGSMLINKSMVSKDSTWFTKALDAGLAEGSSAFWQDIVSATTVLTAPKTFIKELASYGLKYGSVPDLDTFILFADKKFPHDKGKLATLHTIFQPHLERSALKLPTKMDHPTIEVDEGFELG